MSETQVNQAQTQPTISANHNPLVDVKEVTFNFRKTKDEATGIETKREAVVAKLQIPSVEGIVKILEQGGKPLELLQQAVATVVEDYAKSLLADDSSLTSENFPADTINWETIANLPDTDRRGRGISKELWEDFLKSYIETMPAVIGKPVDVVKKQASIMAAKFQPLRTHEKKNELLPKFIEMLTLYVSHAQDAEQYGACIEFLLKKADQFMNADTSANLEDALGF